MNLANGDELASLLASGAFSFSHVVGPQARDEGVRGFLEKFHNRVIERVAVLLQPVFDGVAHL